MPETIEELLADAAKRAELSDMRVESLRLASTLGEARQFHEREARRVIGRYERAIADPVGDEPNAPAKN